MEMENIEIYANKCRSRMYVEVEWVAILFLNFVFINTKVVEEEQETKNIDQYYLIYVNNIYGDIPITSSSKNKYRKRDESIVFVESLVEEIHNLVIDNKDTYKNQKKLKEIEGNAQLKKRKENDEIVSYGDSEFVFPISSVSKSTILKAYLSVELVKRVKSLDNVIDCTPILINGYSASENFYNIEDIKRETHWKDVSIRDPADLHLSLISQGRFNESLVHVYDDSYYYPTSAGKDVDVIIVDSSFHFDYSEFSNTNDRTVKCLGVVKNGILKKSSDSKNCGICSIQHGERVSDALGGIKHGVASRANIYGVALNNRDGFYTNEEVLGALQYVMENLIRPHKTIINYSIFSYELKEYSESLFFRQLRLLIEEITKKGAIFFACAANDHRKIGGDTEYRYYPCELDNVICVGGLDMEDFTNEYIIHSRSNYGPSVNLYAPYTVVSLIKYDEKSDLSFEHSHGSSFSSPITAGIAATIMSENSNIKFDYKSMLQYLIDLGEKGIISGLEKDDNNVFVNNGKHITCSTSSIENKTTTTTSSKTTKPTSSKTTKLTSSKTTKPTSSKTTKLTSSKTTKLTSSKTTKPTSSKTTKLTSSKTTKPTSSKTTKPTSSKTTKPTSNYYNS
ncbi:subtilisin-like protein [Neocallimastix californiae]|uniref:Subtilisin-like protein n=1 Tax=Neocallimastix californiae TaxID=1754190 RepID=A0A1Y2CYR3_9FUNG|nr:subtilisin-like protein [Neocallimastix californiae]|eukprot:ORY52158.1 subtilisin-like protein [Neocallimastix californiae]